MWRKLRLLSSVSMNKVNHRLPAIFHTREVLQFCCVWLTLDRCKVVFRLIYPFGHACVQAALTSGTPIYSLLPGGSCKFLSFGINVKCVRQQNQTTCVHNIYTQSGHTHKHTYPHTHINLRKKTSPHILSLQNIDYFN